MSEPRSEADPPVQLFAVLPAGPRSLPVPVRARNAHQALDDLPLGVYTGFRTFGRVRVLGLEEHLDRTDRCMELLDWSDRLDRPALRRSLSAILAEHPFDEAFVRIDVLARAHGQAGRTLVSLSRLEPVPAEFLAGGVRLEIADGLRRSEPRIKTADFVIRRRPYPLNRKEAYEHLLVDDAGHVLEATSANFYAVLGGEIRTAGRRMLEGITRRFVLRLCEELGLATRLDAPSIEELASADEAFLTSSTRGVVPVVDVAGTTIGDGRPGPRTGALREAYERLAEREARPVGEGRAGEEPAP